MPITHPGVDAYIQKAAPFAQPILQHLRALVHKACPATEEKIKWGMPHFDYKGEMMCSMASFKQHVSFGFWKAALMKDTSLMETARTEVAMGHLGRITCLKDLPSGKQLTAWIKEAMALNEQGVKLPPRSKSPENKILDVPEYFTAALNKNKKARKTFENFSYSHRKEYVQWITEAKTAATREKRMATALEWLAAGKGRNWKYEKS